VIFLRAFRLASNDSYN